MSSNAEIEAKLEAKLEAEMARMGSFVKQLLSNESNVHRVMLNDVAELLRKNGHHCTTTVTTVTAILNPDHSLIVTVPLDKNGDDKPIVLETALLRNGKIGYLVDAGYDDVRTFSSAEEINLEVKRLKAYFA